MRRLAATCRHFALALVGFTPLHAQQTRTFPEDSLWRRVFLVGAEKESDTFVEPRQLAVSSGVVVVLDMGTREVRGFDATTGKSRFVLKATGNGPGEFKRPSLLIPTPWGFAIVDQSSARLTGYRSDGKMHWDIVLPDLFSVSDICIDAVGRINLAYERADSSIVTMDTAGRRLSTTHVPWQPRRSNTASFAHRSFLSKADTEGACALVRFFGGDWAWVDAPRRSATLHPLIERGDEPVVKVTERVRERSLSSVTVEVPETSESLPIARSIALRGDSILVFGADTKRDKLRLIDYYDRATGRYLNSRRLPMIMTAVAVGDNGVFYGTVISENTQALVAFRPERLTKSVQKEIDRARERARTLERERATKRAPDTLVRRPKPPNERR